MLILMKIMILHTSDLRGIVCCYHHIKRMDDRGSSLQKLFFPSYLLVLIMHTFLTESQGISLAYRNVIV